MCIASSFFHDVSGFLCLTFCAFFVVRDRF